MEIVLLKIAAMQKREGMAYPAGSLGWKIREEDMPAREAVVMAVLAKARKAGVRVILPYDFMVVAKPENWEELVAGSQEENYDTDKPSNEETKEAGADETMPPRSRKNTTILEEGFTSKRTEDNVNAPQAALPPKRKRRLLEWLDTEFDRKMEIRLPHEYHDVVALLHSL